MKTLQLGPQQHQSPEAFFLQQLLNKQIPGSHFVMDGYFGPHTAAGVKDFQSKHKLPATGVVDDKTWAALREGVNLGKKIQVTIDDAPGPHNAEMRSLLHRFKIHTMFFVEGTFAAMRPDDVKAILASGQKLGLHTWDHPKLTKLNDAQIAEEIVKTDNLVKQLTGKSMAPHWRPPYGAQDLRVRKAATAAGFTKMWLWDVDSLDWKYQRDTDRILMEVVMGLAKCRRSPCDILFHDKPTSVKALDILLPLLIEEGNEIVGFP
jgi:peptidoglycan/xylan/chitin deacetylase (PgdA/CDA1 family)